MVKRSDSECRFGKRRVPAAFYVFIAALFICFVFATEDSACAVSKKKLDKPVITMSVSGEDSVLIGWDKVSGAVKYEIWRDTGNGWKKYRTLKGRKALRWADRTLSAGNNAAYKIRAVSKDMIRSPFSEKVKLSCRIATPTITSLNSSGISWHKVTGASYYRVYTRKDKKSKWKSIGKTADTTFYISGVSRSAYYTVRAFGSGQSSGYDKTFTLKNRKYSSKKVLIEGDSITYPYYSWARRTARLLGFDYTDRARNGARISATSRKRSKNIYARSMKQGFKGYDIIIIAAGTNDYGHAAKLGTIKSKSPKTFYGAYKAILKKARKDAPEADIILCTPQERGKQSKRRNISGYSSNNGKGYNLTDIRNAVYELADEYDCYVYDAPASKVITAKNVHKTTFDLLHPNYQSHIKISDDFEKYLLKYIL